MGCETVSVENDSRKWHLVRPALDRGPLEVVLDLLAFQVVAIFRVFTFDDIAYCIIHKRLVGHRRVCGERFHLHMNATFRCGRRREFRLAHSSSLCRALSAECRTGVVGRSRMKECESKRG